ncbi:MAG: hypothetical protein ACLFPE_06285 [Bacteroidales bacterium]
MESSYFKILIIVFLMTGMSRSVAPEQTREQCVADCNKSGIFYCADVISNTHTDCRFSDVYCAGEEAYIDDIPFDTGEIAEQVQKMRKEEPANQGPCQENVLDFLMEWISLMWKVK